MVPPSRGLSAQAPRACHGNACQTSTSPEPSPGAWLPSCRPTAYARGWPSLRRPILKPRKIVVKGSARFLRILDRESCRGFSGACRRMARSERRPLASHPSGQPGCLPVRPTVLLNWLLGSRVDGRSGSTRISATLTGVRCEWESCTRAANHMFSVTFPDEETEIWRVCRPHDRELKILAVARRLPRPLDPESPAAPVVHCAQCDRALQEPISTEESTREPCPQCGSTARIVRVTDTATVHEGFRVRSKRPGKGGWLKDIKSGDDYTRDLAAWGERTLERDREHDQYRELIKLYDGTEIESSARLRDHHD
jgi:predicted RNA-binding Zn-ribbon protein involved in translation (DUF1610 family)